jgi:two-component system response regulator MprA
MAETRELILLVEDDPAVLSSVRRRLVFEGYRVETAESGPEAVEKAKIQPDIIILDVMLPGFDGLEVVERVRKVSAVPILMLTAKDTVPDRVAGFESGADDYLIKPFAIEELLARIRALLRRTRAAVPSGGAGDVLAYGDLRLDPGTREVFRGSMPIPLSQREFDMLEYFLRNPRQVLTRDQIFAAVWGSDYMGESNIIDVNVKSLRQKLEMETLPRLIQTVRGVGYALREG